MSRRKMMKKTQYHELERTFNREDCWPGAWREKLQHEGKLMLELGCGKAELSLELAEQHPANFYIGVDLKADRMWVAAREAEARGIRNVAFLCINLLELDRYFAPHEVDELWVTFPDPFPKKKQEKHRMLNPHFLEKYQSILHPEGTLHYKTDNLELFQFSLEVFVEQRGIVLDQLSFDLHARGDLPADTKALTTYEKKFMALGKTINYVRLHFTDKIVVPKETAQHLGYMSPLGGASQNSTEGLTS